MCVPWLSSLKLSRVRSLCLFHSFGFVVRPFGFAMDADLGKFHVEMQRGLLRLDSSSTIDAQGFHQLFSGEVPSAPVPNMVNRGYWRESGKFLPFKTLMKCHENGGTCIYIATETGRKSCAACGQWLKVFQKDKRCHWCRLCADEEYREWHCQCSAASKIIVQQAVQIEEEANLEEGHPLWLVWCGMPKSEATKIRRQRGSSARSSSVPAPRMGLPAGSVWLPPLPATSPAPPAGLPPNVECAPPPPPQWVDEALASSVASASYHASASSVASASAAGAEAGPAASRVGTGSKKIEGRKSQGQTRFVMTDEAKKTSTSVVRSATPCNRIKQMPAQAEEVWVSKDSEWPSVDRASASAAASALGVSSAGSDNNAVIAAIRALGEQDADFRRQCAETMQELVSRHDQAMNILATETAHSSQQWATVLSRMDQLEKSQTSLVARMDQMSNKVVGALEDLMASMQDSGPSQEEVQDLGSDEEGDQEQQSSEEERVSYSSTQSRARSPDPEELL